MLFRVAFVFFSGAALRWHAFALANRALVMARAALASGESQPRHEHAWGTNERSVVCSSSSREFVPGG